MAGRMQAMLRRFECFGTKINSLIDELNEMQERYWRLRSGVWAEHFEAASNALATAASECEVLVFMTNDLTGGRDNEPDVGSVADDKGDVEADDEGDEGDPVAENLNHTPAPSEKEDPS